jgi:hypothetical protein
MNSFEDAMVNFWILAIAFVLLMGMFQVIQ